MSTSLSQYLFFLGRTPELSYLELTRLFPESSVERLDTDIVRISFVLPIVPADCMALLGGTVKIAQIMGQEADVSVHNLSKYFSAGEVPHKLTFGISTYGNMPGVARETLKTIKEELTGLGVDARFMEARKGNVVSAVAVEKEAMFELNCVANTEGILIAKTIALQPFEEWNKRDYGRPKADPKAGMLPPKIARMIVNVAVGGEAQGKYIYDPFCGMGTVLAEALLVGVRVIGSDISTDTVEKAKQNILWLKTMYPKVADSATDLFVADAVHVAEKIGSEQIDAIVTEPFMGSTEVGGSALNNDKRSIQQAKNTIKGLENLYLGCFKEWHPILKPEGIIVIALPEYIIGSTKLFVKRVIDSCEKLGYTTLAGPIEYSRPNATVRRQFYIFQKINRLPLTNNE